LATIILQLDPRRLTNSDLDIRYKLPDLLIERSGGQLSDGGYDYVSDEKTRHLQLYLATDDPDAAIPGIIELLKSVPVLGNDLSNTPIAIEDDNRFEVIYPPAFDGEVLRPRNL
jgi:hypothetical protein